MKKINIIILFTCAILFSSCDNFLDIQPVGKVIPKDAQGYRELLTQAYSIVPNDRGMSTFRSDEFTLNENSSPYDLEAFQNIWNWDDNAPIGGTNSFGWKQYYQMLFIDNFIIENKNKIGVGTKEDINQIVGEAYIMRAYLHFLLVNLYGVPYTAGNPAIEKGIPLKLNTISDNALSRNTVAEVYASVLSDIDIAEPLLNKKTWDIGFNYRFNTLSVNSLRSRTFLYMGEWSKSLAASEAVLMVQNSLTDLRVPSSILPNNYKSPESIVALEQPMTSSYVRAAIVSNSILDLYKEGDLRKALYFKVTDGEYNVIKGGKNDFSCSFRVGEIYLNAAEAAAHIAGKEDDAKKYLLTLMEKRYNSDTYATKKTIVNTMNGQDLITEIANERARELAFEGHRWFDLRRTTRPRIEKTFGDNTYVLEQNDPRYTIRIPAEAVASNPNLAN